MPEYNPDFPRQDGFCWIPEGTCQAYRPYYGQLVRVPISFTTTTGAPFKLRLRYVPVNADGKETAGPTIREHEVARGLSYIRVTDDLSNVPCGTRLKLTVSASIKGPVSKAAYVYNYCPIG